MDDFAKIIAAVVISVILSLTLSGLRKESALLLSVTASVMTLLAAFHFLEPVISFLKHLQSLACIDSALFGIVLKAVGIGLLAELVVLICSDAGNSALGKSLQVTASAAILWLSLPLFEQLIELLENIMGAL